MLLPFEQSADDKGKQEDRHMVQGIAVINLKVMNVWVRILALIKGNVATWQWVGGEGLYGPWSFKMFAERKYYIKDDSYL